MNPENVTREILWNVPAWAVGLMYALFGVALLIFGYGTWRRVSAWKKGRKTEHRPLRWRRFAREAVLQATTWRSRPAGASHAAIFWGFIVLFIGTCIVGAEDYGARLTGREPLFFYGGFYLVVSFLLEVFGLLFIGGLLLAALRRVRDPRYRPLSRPIDRAIIWLFLVIGASGFLIEALRIAGAPGGMTERNFERWSFVGWGLATLFAPLPPSVLEGLHLAGWVLHMVLTMVFIAAIPFCKLRHIFFSPINVALDGRRSLGKLEGVSLEDVEETGRYGVSEVGDFTRKQLLSFDACTECARCHHACPAQVTGKPLSPMRVVLDAADAARSGRPLHGERITPEVLWACTNCGACVHECPVAIDQLGAIMDMRRSLVGEGEIRGSEQKALRSAADSGNPWGLPQDERLLWAEGLDVPTLEDEPDPEVLYWVGCAAAYDRRNQKVARALVKVLRAAGLRFAVLGKKERCSGDPARRLGDEFTFTELASTNIETLGAAKFDRIVTSCAHCFNTLKNEYPDLGGKYRVVHHTQLIEELEKAGKLPLARRAERRIAFHDACFIGRHNGEYEAPREALRGAGARLAEPRESRDLGFCCGAGGGRMWMEETVGTRVNVARWKQLQAARPEAVAVSCPFCMVMLSDAATAEDSSVDVLDVAEVVAEALEEERE